MNPSENHMSVLLCVSIMCLVTCVESVAQLGVARAIPTPHMALTGTPMTVISGISRANCLKKCLQWKCSAFNYGQQECELLSVYLCVDTEFLTPRSDYKYYDVETDSFIEMVDNYRTEPDCLTYNRCSPKCYSNTTPATTTTTTTTPTTTSTTPSTTTTTPTTTTTTPTITTTTPTTTTTTPTTTTTTTPTTTTTTPTTTSTTPTPTTTVPAGTPGPPGPGDVGYSCTVGTDCTTPFSDCRNLVVCECVAGYSYNPPTKTCVKPCPGSYGSTYTKTKEYVIMEQNDVVLFNVANADFCKTSCSSMPGCVSFEFDTLLHDCNLATVSKDDFGTTWVYNLFFVYWQRDCA